MCTVCVSIDSAPEIVTRLVFFFVLLGSIKIADADADDDDDNLCKWRDDEYPSRYVLFGGTFLAYCGDGHQDTFQLLVMTRCIYIV